MALNILNKYVGSLLGIALLFFVLLDKKAWKIFKNPKAYLAVLVCFILLIPHMVWLYENNFEMLNYIGTRNGVGKIKSWVRHIIYPTKFFLAQILFSLPAILTFYFFARKSERTTFSPNKEKKIFLLCLGIIPTAFWMISSFVSGNSLKDMWNFPSLFVLGIIAFYFYPRAWTSSVCQKYAKVMLGWSLVLALGYACQCLISPSERFHADCSQIAKDLKNNYYEATGKELEYVGGNIWFSDMVSLYGGAKPMIWLKPESNPWFEAEDFHKKGALVVAENLGEYQGYQLQYNGQISDPTVVEMIYKSPLGKKKKKQLIWGIYQEEQNAQ